VIVRDFAKVKLDIGSQALVSSGNFLLYDTSDLSATNSTIQVIENIKWMKQMI